MKSHSVIIQCRSEIPARRRQVRLRARGPRCGGEAALPGEGEEEHQGATGRPRLDLHEQGGLLHPRLGKGATHEQLKILGQRLRESGSLLLILIKGCLFA